MKELDYLLDNIMKKELDKYFLIKKVIVYINKFKKNNPDDLSSKFIRGIKSNICNIILDSAQKNLMRLYITYYSDFSYQYNSINSEKLDKININSIMNQNINEDYQQFENDIFIEKNKIFSFKPKLSFEETSFLNNYIKNMFTPNKKIPSEERQRQFLEDAINFSVILKKHLLIQQLQNKNNFINIDDYLNDIKNYSKDINSSEDANFVVSLISKMAKEKGNDVYVTKKKDEKFNGIELASLQTFLCLQNQYKYELHFDLGEEKNEMILQNKEEQKRFISSLKKELSLLLKVDSERIIITNVHHGCAASDIVITKLTEEERRRLMTEGHLRHLGVTEIKKKKIFDILELNSDILDPRFDRNKKWGINETRGKERYLPPLNGWNGFGLNVINKYDDGNNIWLDYHNKEGEYAIAYLGISNLADKLEDIVYLDEDSQNVINLINEPQSIQRNDMNILTGDRIVVFQDPKIAEENAGYLEINGCLIVIMFMMRINPLAKENYKNPYPRAKYKNAWILDTNPKNIRPYRILIKKLNTAPILNADPIITKTELNREFLNNIELSDEKTFEDLSKTKDFELFSKINGDKADKVDKYIFAIKLYSSYYYKYINTYLREEGTVLEELKKGEKIFAKMNENQIRAWAKCLNYALINYKINDVNYIEDNTIVYRGIKQVRFPKNLGIGAGFYFPEFISTSLKEDFALEWLGGKGTLLTIILRNNGTNGHQNYCQYIDSLSISNTKRRQYEVLLASNCFYRITKIIRMEKIDSVTLICEGLLTK